MRLVPIVYVNVDGLPTCYEVVEPVDSPSQFTSTGQPHATSQTGSFGRIF